MATLESAKRRLAQVEADQKSFDEMPGKLQATAAEASKRLAALTEELAKVQALAEAAEADQKLFAQAYGPAKPPEGSAAQITKSSGTPASR